MQNTTRGRSAPAAALALAGIGMLFMQAAPVAAQELVLGEESFYPGIVLIFEGAVRDAVTPRQAHLEEELTDVHIEARANWNADETLIPEGTPPAGFVAYMNIYAQVTNQTTGKETFATLTPHLNLIDNLHYARNIALPGEQTDLYTVKFFVSPPDKHTLALHRDWLNEYGDRLFPRKEFTYENVDFFDIATAPPRKSAFEVPNKAPGGE